jgi:hypothetical protein
MVVYCGKLVNSGCQNKDMDAKTLREYREQGFPLEPGTPIACEVCSTVFAYDSAFPTRNVLYPKM